MIKITIDLFIFIFKIDHSCLFYINCTNFKYFDVFNIRQVLIHLHF